PINTKKDENSFVVSLNGEHAYFASDRLSGNKNYDLYYFDLYKEARPVFTTFVKGIVVDQSSSTPVSSNVQLIDLETGKIIGESISDPVDGSYLVSVPNGKDYALNIAAKNYLFYSQNFSLKDQPAEKPFLLNVELKPIAVGNSVVLRNIFFKTDSYELEDESKVELKELLKLLNQNATMKIEVNGHTDNEGDATHNQKLSESRAKTVNDYLIANGISASRLSHKGFGETKPIASNDNEDGRSQNRRTEFTITAK
ncbi:MAG: OmpA family protein, partial [Chitinophagales bacterium]|nr:OmpA family protein [Chitinophagales bacterium]